MKHTRTFLLASFIATGFGITDLAAGEAEATASSHVEGEGGQISSHTKTVTVTSDGNRTIKKTVIEKNGVRQTFTEITDQFGNIIGGGQADADGRGQAGGGGGAGEDETPDGDGGDKDEDRGPWLGVRVKEIAESIRAQLGLAAKQGVLVEAVAAESPAAKAGISEEDLMLSLNGESIADAEELAELLDRYEPGTQVEIEIMRDGQRRTVQVTLEAQPDDADQPGTAPVDGVDGGAEGGGRQMKVERQMQVEVNGGDFDAILNNPNLPDDFKKTVRDMQRRMENFQGEQEKRAREMEREMEDFQRRHQIQPAD